MTFFAAKGISAGYGNKKILSGISFELEAESIAGLLGANGCGKTTLLKSICGILPHEGTCYLQEDILEEMNPKEIASSCSYIPQRSGISIDISVLDVVLMGFNPKLKLLEHPDKKMKEAAFEALKLVGMEGKENWNYQHLSEGQKQLCILARTIVLKNRLLLLDEPESSLDFRYRYQMMEMLRHHKQICKNSVLISLHDPHLALNCCDKILLLDKGKLIGEIHPKTDSVEQMEKLLSVLYGRISLYCCFAKDGSSQLMMLKEREE